MKPSFDDAQHRSATSNELTYPWTNETKLTEVSSCGGKCVYIATCCNFVYSPHYDVSFCCPECLGSCCCCLKAEGACYCCGEHNYPFNYDEKCAVCNLLTLFIAPCLLCTFSCFCGCWRSACLTCHQVKAGETSHTRI